MKKVRWGIVGAGNIANMFAEAVNNLDCAELTAVASRDEERAKAFAKKHSIENVFCGYENMAKSDAIDAVYIATQHPFHISGAELFLNAKKPVLCEKPLCVNAYQGQKLKEIAEKNGTFLMEAMWTRFLPAIKEAQRIVERGEIGEVLGVEADFCYNFTDKECRVYKKDLAGGSLLDVGVYCLHFASLFLGNSPETITALAKNLDGVDAHTTMLLKYKNGAIATLSSAIVLDKPETAYVYGTKGRITIPRFHSATELYVTDDKGERKITKEFIGNGFEEQIIEVCDCMGKGKLQSDTMPIDESIIMLKQMDEIRAQIGITYLLEGER